jgi:hypothetical protein
MSSFVIKAPRKNLSIETPPERRGVSPISHFFKVASRLPEHAGERRGDRVWQGASPEIILPLLRRMPMDINLPMDSAGGSASRHARLPPGSFRAGRFFPNSPERS